MNTASRRKTEKGVVEAILDDAVSEEEMDQLLAGHVDEVNAKLEEARGERGESAPFEPLHVVLQAGRQRLQRRNKR